MNVERTYLEFVDERFGQKGRVGTSMERVPKSDEKQDRQDLVVFDFIKRYQSLKKWLKLKRKCQ